MFFVCNLQVASMESQLQNKVIAIFHLLASLHSPDLSPLAMLVWQLGIQQRFPQYDIDFATIRNTLFNQDIR